MGHHTVASASQLASDRQQRSSWWAITCEPVGYHVRAVGASRRAIAGWHHMAGDGRWRSLAIMAGCLVVAIAPYMIQ